MVGRSLSSTFGFSMNAFFHIQLCKIADEMKASAEANPCTFQDMIKGISEKKINPDLVRHVFLSDAEYRIQFSIDVLGHGGDKRIQHLSFARTDRILPDKTVQEQFQTVFFGNDEVVQLPSFHSHVVQMAKLI
jgi:hypothetical protein